MGDSPDTKRAKTIYSSMVIRIDPKNRNFEQSYRGCTNDFISRELFLEWCLSQEDFLIRTFYFLEIGHTLQKHVVSLQEI